MVLRDWILPKSSRRLKAPSAERSLRKDVSMNCLLRRSISRTYAEHAVRSRLRRAKRFATHLVVEFAHVELPGAHVRHVEHVEGKVRQRLNQLCSQQSTNE